MRLFLTAVLFTVVLFESVFAQTENDSIVLNQTNGLPSNYVYDVFEDKHGFFWLATDLGLYRYDGYEYKLYASEMQSSLAGSCIQQDIYGRIWYENFDGYVFYIDKGVVHQIKQDKPIQFLPFGLTEKYLYVIVKNGVNIYDLKSLNLIKCISIEWVYAEHAALIANSFYITDQSKVVCIDEKFNVYQTGINIDVSQGVKMVMPVDNKVAVFYRNGSFVNFYDKKLAYLYQNQLSLNGSFHSLVKLNRDFFGIASSKGLYTVDFSGQKLKFVSLKWPNYSIAKYHLDRSGNEWISTVGNGVFISPRSTNYSSVLQKGNFTNIRKYGDRFVTADNEGNIYTLESKFATPKLVLSAKNEVAYLYKDDHTDLFMYTNSAGLFVFKGPEKKHFNNVALKQAVWLDDKYYLVAASGFYGLFKNPFAKEKSSEWDKYFSKNVFNLEDFSAFKTFVRAKTVAYNPQLKLIVAGTNVGTFINRLGVEQELKLDGKTFFVKKLLWCENVLFALTTAGDLYRTSDFKSLEKIDVPENGLRLAKHHNHIIYLLGNNFLYAYQINKNKIFKYDIDYNTNSVNDYLVEGNDLMMATVSGIVKINLHSTLPKATDVPFYINDFYVNGVKRNSLSDLDYDENNIRLNYSYLNYGKKNGVVISYRLNNENWIVANEKERDIYFQALAPSKYLVSFKVNGKEIAEKVEIEIAVPIWKAWWFYLLLFATGATALGLYYSAKTRIYTQQIQLLNDKILLEKSLSKSVLTSIKAQMNPHFFYNALNTIQGFIFTNDKLSANNYLAKFSKLTRLVLEMSEKEIISLNEEIDAIKMYLDLEKMRFGKKIDYKLNVVDIPNAEMVELPPMLVQPLVENAIKHGLLHLESNGLLKITYQKIGDVLMVEVDDNGIGRERSSTLKYNKNNKHSSFAIKANQNRLDILNAGRTNQLYTLEIIDKYEHNTPIGTLARLKIPLNV